MPRAERAVILGAGQGSRLLPLTEDLPKCLLDLEGRSMLEWQLRGLAEVGVGEAVVVTGFRATRSRRRCSASRRPACAVRTLFNPFYKVADNLASCWMARAELRGTCLLLNGDTLFEPAIARRLIEAPAAPITVTIDRKPRYDDDDMKVVDRRRPAARRSARSCRRRRQRRIDRLPALRGATARRCSSPSSSAPCAPPKGPGLWYLSAIHRLADCGRRRARGLDRRPRLGRARLPCRPRAGTRAGRGLAGDRPAAKVA